MVLVYPSQRHRSHHSGHMGEGGPLVFILVLTVAKGSVDGGGGSRRADVAHHTGVGPVVDVARLVKGVTHESGAKIGSLRPYDRHASVLLSAS